VFSFGLENHVAHLLSIDDRSGDFGSERFKFFFGGFVRR
jgi:hypothetical protein